MQGMLLYLEYTCHDLNGILHYYVIRCFFSSLMVGGANCVSASLSSVCLLIPFELLGVAITTYDMCACPPKIVLMAVAI